MLRPPKTMHLALIGQRFGHTSLGKHTPTSDTLILLTTLKCLLFSRTVGNKPLQGFTFMHCLQFRFVSITDQIISAVFHPNLRSSVNLACAIVLLRRCTRHISCQHFLREPRPSAHCQGGKHAAVKQTDTLISRFLPKLHAGTTSHLWLTRGECLFNGLLCWCIALPLLLFAVPLSRGLWQKRGPSSLTTMKTKAVYFCDS